MNEKSGTVTSSKFDLPSSLTGGPGDIQISLTTPKENILQEADRLTSQDRNKSYGHPFADFTKIASYWSVYLKDKLKPGTTLEPEDIAIMQILLKVSRETHAYKRDNLVDISGYARTKEMIQERRENA